MLRINKIFGPITQSEKDATDTKMFIRLSGCNLACSWCPVPFTWNWTGAKFKNPFKYDPKREIHKMNNEKIIVRLFELSPIVRRVVITGGEPMLQQKKLISLMKRLKSFEYWIEVETNGTIIPSDKFLNLIDRISCRPKRSNSGSDNYFIDGRENLLALEKIATSGKANFEFTIVDEFDIEDIIPFVYSFLYQHEVKQIRLVPAKGTKKQQEKRQQIVKEICEREGFSFNPQP